MSENETYEELPEEYAAYDSKQDQVEPPVEPLGGFAWGKLLIRGVLALFVIGIVGAVIGVIAFLSYRSSRDKPLEVKVYPGAVMVNDEVIYDGYDHQQYLTSDPIESVEAFYDGQDDMECERQYQRVQQIEGEDPIREGYLFTSCIIDHSGLGMTQYTKVVLQPRYDDAGGATGEVIIDVQRYWGN
jgi:hypothetical protein